MVTYPDGKPITWIVNVSNLVWMPDDTPFGNLIPKLFWVMQQLAHANRRLEESANYWNEAMAGSIGPALVEHRATANEAVFALRRAADELVTLVAVLEDRTLNGEYPKKPRYDSVGTAFDKNRQPKTPLWGRHDWLLRTLNDLANAQKHSFVDSDTSVIGKLQPCATAIHLPQNNLEKYRIELYVVALDDLASAYCSFLAEVLNHLVNLTDPIRSSGSA